MNECFSTKGRVAFVASLVANIFLVAFLAGQLTAPHPLPPSEDMRSARFGRHMMSPMFGPHDFFGVKEGNQQRMSKEFEQLDALRNTFVEQLSAGPVTKEQALEHFRQVDQLMDTIRSDARDNVAEKISTMTDDERARLVQRLADHRRSGQRRNEAEPDVSDQPDVVQQPAPVPAQGN